MTLKDSRFKYRLIDWVISRDDLAIGDRVVWFDLDSESGVFGYVVGMTHHHDNKILVCRDSSEITELVDFMDTIVFKYGKLSGRSRKCSCGAKHTSNPKFHLSYCDLA